MKVAIITDQHFGARKSSRVFHDFFNKFYKNVFFPTLKKRGIDTVLDLGDTYDNRRTLDLWAANWSKTEYWDKLRDMGIKVHSLVGNHTAYFKDTNDVNTLDGIVGEYTNISIYNKATEVEIGGLPILFIPWINQQNKEETYALIEKSKCPVAMGHLELNGFEAHPGHVMESGMDKTFFNKFKRVFSGHYHQKSTKGNISYLGNPYQLYWNDYGCKRGFHVFDTTTLKTTFYRNPFDIFYKLYYNNGVSIPESEDLKGSFVKLIVEEKGDYQKFDYAVKQLQNIGLGDLKIVEDLSAELECSDSTLETEDTMTLLESYIDEIELKVDKSNVKSVMRSLYVEASEL